MVKYQVLDKTFSALSDPTRRDILERLARGPATISELAQPFGLSLPGMLKHIRVLEEADLVKSHKDGRTRRCELGPADLDEVAEYARRHKERWERRLDRLESYLAKRKEAKR
jgi:DNA-binding transcriptional ArsR family regulator